MKVRSQWRTEEEVCLAIETRMKGSLQQWGEYDLGQNEFNLSQTFPVVVYVSARRAMLGRRRDPLIGTQRSLKTC